MWAAAREASAMASVFQNVRKPPAEAEGCAVRRNFWKLAILCDVHVPSRVVPSARIGIGRRFP